MAVGRCGNCGRTGPMARCGCSTRPRAWSPAVRRATRSCCGVVRGPDRAWLDMRGLTYLQLPYRPGLSATVGRPGPSLVQPRRPALHGSAIDGLAGAGTMVHIPCLAVRSGVTAMVAPADRLADRLLAWAERRPERLLGYNPWQLGAHVLRTAARHRVTGPAAEMSFVALLTLVPLTVAVGAALGLIERFVGPEKIARDQDAAIALVRVVISPRVTDRVVDPFVRAQLSQQHGGAGLGGVLLTWWVASHLFAATSRALDAAYQDRHRRQTFHQRLIALAFAFASVVIVVLTLGILVDEPFVDERRALAEQLGLGHWLATAW